MKKLLFAISITAMLGACCNNSPKSDTQADTKKAACTSISVDSFLVIAPDFIGKELTVKGTVDHVCKHGGKRIKIFSSSPNNSIHGEASEKAGAFKAELEGSDVCLTGTVLETRIDMAYVDEWEAQVKKAMEEKSEEADMDHKKGVDHHATLENIKKHREEIEASEKGYIAFYALEVNDYHECNSDASSDCNEKHADTETAKAPCGDKKEGAPCCGSKDDSSETKTPCGHAH